MFQTRRVTFILGVEVCILLFISGCGITTTQTTTTSATTGITSNTSSNATSTFPVDLPPLGVYVQLSSVPKVGETVEMFFTVRVNAADFYSRNPGTEKAKAWIEVWWTNPWGSYLEAKQAVRIPIEDILVNGDTTWEGNLKERGGPIELRSKVQLPKEGIWRIEGYFTGEGWKKPVSSHDEIVTTSDSAFRMNSDELRNSPLAYLDNFNYGFLKEARKIDYLKERTEPVTIELDISKVPKIGEEITLTVTAASLHNVSDWSMEISFYKRLETENIKVSGSELLVGGDLQWHGDLKQESLTVFTATIKFPEDGDWQILCSGNSQENFINHKAGNGDIVFITISSDLSFYGWKPLKVTNTTQTYTGPTTTTTKIDR